MKTILIFIAKIIGKAWVFACIPFRGYARSVVYNYVLQNNKREWLKRLWEREPTETGFGWDLKDIHLIKRTNNMEIRGFIEHREVSSLKFYLVVLFIWGWLDDDSNQDTTDTGYIKTLLEGGGRTSWHEIFRPFLKKIDTSKVVYGNAFDLGDVRADHPYFNFWATLVWNDRNTAMNFQYLWLDY